MPALRVVLVHGIGRTPLSLRRLATRLRAAGLRPERFGYLAALEPFDRIVTRLAARCAASADAPWAAVGHSLGGLLLRAAVARLPARRRPQRLVLLGTPHRVPRLARRLHRSRAYRLIHGDCGQLLADPGRMASIPLPGVPLTVLAGTRGPRGRWSPFGDEANDGIVSVSEVGLPGLDPIEVPVLHTFLPQDARVARLVLAGLDGIGPPEALRPSCE
jgi:pimeloyl-ACP methyl ester carboxylesterase